MIRTAFFLETLIKHKEIEDGASIIHLPDWILPLRPSWSHLEEPGTTRLQNSCLGIHPGIPADLIISAMR
jgi:hypothetical protein